MSTSIKALVDRGAQLRLQIKERQVELKAIEAKLTDVALWKDHEPLADPDREGRRYLARGSEITVPVIFTADKLMKTVRDNSPEQAAMAAACHPLSLAKFYTFKQIWEINADDGKKFRTLASEELGLAAPAFISACLARDKHGIAKSDIKIVWDDAVPVAQKEAA